MPNNTQLPNKKVTNSFKNTFKNRNLVLSFIFSSVFFLFSIESYAQSRATISGNISDQFGNLPGARVSIEGTIQTTTTDVNGNYSFSVEEGTYILTTQFVMYNTLSKSVTVEVGEEAILNFELETAFSIDQPVSLGSRATPKSSLKTSAPVDVIGPQIISNSSRTELSAVLHYLAPSFHSTHQTIADGTDHIDPATLRGLGTDQVLVLINGKRRHNSSLLNVNGTVGRGSVGTDFNAIPLATIERIEILREGATSQYGSDAIAGVINIILKEQTEVIDIDNRVLINTAGDGFENYSSGNFGLKIGNNGFLNVTAEYRKRKATNRAGDYTGTVYSNNPSEDAVLIEENDFFGQTQYSGKRVMEIGNAETQNLALYFNGEFQMTPTATIYLHGGRNYREGKSKGFFRFPKETDRVVPELFPNGFSPEILTDIQDDAIVVGIKGVKNEFNIDFSHSIGGNRIDYTVNNSNNASLGIASPRTFYSGGFAYHQNTTNLDLARQFKFLKGISVAFGAELRVENYQIIAGEEASYITGESTYVDQDGVERPRISGAQIFPGIQPENELSRFRTNSAGYLDIETNITDNLLFKTGGRYESSNDFGSQGVYKLSSRYRINDHLSIRGSYSKGFRAPSLHQVFFQNISSQFIDGDIVQVGTFNNESAVATEAFKIERLRAEISKHFSAGLSGKLDDRFTYSLDYYLINIKDRIVLSGQFSEGYETVLAPFNVGAAQFFTNAIDSRTMGGDISIHYKKSDANGAFNGSLSANITNTQVVGPIKVSSSLEGQESVVFNREEIARVEKAQPNFKLTSMLSYEFDKYKLQLGNTLFGEVQYLHPDDGDPKNWIINEYTGLVETRDQTFSPKVLTDISVAYQFNDNIKATLGGNNIANVYPDAHTHSANRDQGNFVYSRRVQQFGVSGANYYFRLLLRL
ncbi:TonB-dependent receptor [Ulvibacter litoralis]|uniref:Iron complex outermembrane recepter protein n=1 Tax=Ulvibacter litoralis TaxID=227084 RepID=A0A1G7HP05_9FLAO|nr:TonB-dependent receptor [Ulvibacter litoralis]GHC58537.1 TonB-dependent receptor [Ulvibacter litoralis]SDF02202.1 iron complex outermembrane recepter protein [Ulvibacter litoralis]